MKQKHVLLTGGSGFMGSHAADMLVADGYNVVAADNLSSGSNDNLTSKAIFVNVDIGSAAFEDVFKNYEIDTVIHFAAQTSVSASNKNQLFDAEQNIINSIKLFSFAKKYGVKKLTAISTAAVYGVPAKLPLKETALPAPISPYGLSKLTMEKYLQLSGLAYDILRFSNVYGERQSARGEAGVISIFAERMLHGEDVFIEGDGHKTRDFIYVKDAVKAACKIALSPAKGEIYNISSGVACSINDLFNIMSVQFKYGKKAVYIKDREFDIEHSVLDNSKISLSAGFKPEHNLELGVEAFYKYLSNGKIND